MATVLTTAPVLDARSSAPPNADVPVRQDRLLAMLLVGFPVWWALGLGGYAFLIMAVPMALRLARRRRVQVPPGFAVWLLFLLWAAGGVLVLGVHLQGTVDGTAQGRLIGYGDRLLGYLAVTVIMLYAGNLSPQELSQRRLVRMLGVLFLSTVCGGVLGVLTPHLQFTSPFELVLPAHVRSNLYVQSLVHPAVAQLQDVLGYQSPRPKAPFTYTNAWGNNLSILMVWFVVGWWVMGSRSRRLAVPLVLAVAAVPVVYSLNRGLWLGLGIAALYVAVRLALGGRVVPFLAVSSAVAVVAVLLVASPLNSIVQQRLVSGRSNDIRQNLTTHAVEAAVASPVIGLGSTRNLLGSHQSITVGRSPSCPRCGNAPIGSNGQLWQMLISHGFVGAALYLAFFVQALWRYRRDRSAVGIAGSLCLVLALFYALIYNAVPSPLCFYLLSLTLLWRNDMARRAGAEPA